ncbi:MAG: glycosyl transferase family 1, partial [Moorea sp. SIO3I7]|nr:glycosyl transferase family 1 [Moorena sp. SIO3I7]
MTHFGILCIEVPGHLNPMFALARELQKRGHRFTLLGRAKLGSSKIKEKALAAGLEFQLFPKTENYDEVTPKTLKTRTKLDKLAALQYSVNILKNNITYILEEGAEIIEEIGIESLLVDQVLSYGGLIAEFLNLPYVTVCNCLLMNSEVNVPPYYTTWNYNPTWWNRLRNQLFYNRVELIMKPVSNVIAEYRQKWNLSPRSDPYLVDSPLAIVCQNLREFEFPRQELDSWFHFTGPFYDPGSREPIPFPWEKLTDKPLIYASLGTLQNLRADLFETIATAC